MSETLTTSPASSVTSLLDALHTQQAGVPDDQRGLSKELADLRERLEKDPSLETNQQYLTQVAWLVQDWQKFSGTNRQPALSPLLQIGFRQMAGEYPGLENGDLRHLLGQTGDLQDRELVTSIRSLATEVAQMPPVQQSAMLVSMATKHLLHQVMDVSGAIQSRGAQADPQQEVPPVATIAQSAPDLSPRNPETTPLDRPTTQTEVPLAAQRTEETEPFPDTNNLSGARESDALNDREGDVAPAPPHDGYDPFDTPADDQPAPTHDTGPDREGDSPETAGITAEKDAEIRRKNRSMSNIREDQEPDIQTSTTKNQETQHPGKGADKSQKTQPIKSDREQSSPKQGPTTPTPDPEKPAVQVAQPAAVPAVGSILSRTASHFASWGSGKQAEADSRRINKLISDVDRNIAETRSNHQQLKNVAAPFFKKLEAAAQQEGTTVPKVLAEMTEGGRHEALGQEFMKERMHNPDVQVAYGKLVDSLSNMKRNVLSLQAEAGQRQASESPAVKMLEQRVGEVGLEVEAVPGVEPGKTLVQSIGDIVEKLVEKTRAFLGLGKNQEQDRDNGPSMGA